MLIGASVYEHVSGPPVEGNVDLVFSLATAGDIILGTTGRNGGPSAYGLKYDWDISIDGGPQTRYTGMTSATGTLPLGSFPAGTHVVTLSKRATSPKNWIAGLCFYGSAYVGTRTLLVKVEGEFPAVALDSYCY